MGKMLSFLVVATLISGAYAYRSSTEHNLETTGRQTERQEEVIAREIARSGYNHVLSLAKKEEATQGPAAPMSAIIAAVNGADGRRYGTLSGGSYDAWLEPAGTSGYDVVSIGAYGEATHHIGHYRQHNYIEVDEPSTLKVTFQESMAGYCSAVFVEIIQPKNNNGHGNNADGVDASNPGGSKEGEDSDPTVDDENKTGSGSTKSRYELIFMPGNNRNGDMATYATTLQPGERLNFLLAVDADYNCEKRDQSVGLNDHSFDYTRSAFIAEVSSFNDFVEGPYAMVEPHPSLNGLWRVAFEDLEFGNQTDGLAKLGDIKANGYYNEHQQTGHRWRTINGIKTYGGDGWDLRNGFGYYGLRDYGSDADGHSMPDFSDQVFEVELIPLGGTSARSQPS